MQYRGHTVPLITLSDAAQMKPIDGEGDLVVLISTIAGHEVGLLGVMPVDAMETHAVIDTITHRQAGLFGSAIVNQQTILIVNLNELAKTARPDLFTAQSKEGINKNPPDNQTSVLLAEDSDFFRA